MLLLGTQWKQIGNKRIPSSALCKVHVEVSHWPCDNYGPKTICHHFQPGLLPMPNPLGTYWELEESLGNFLWTHQKKKNPPSPTPQRKTMRPSSFYVEPFHWLYEILFLKLFVTIFLSPGLMESMGEYGCIGVERFHHCRYTWNRPWSTYNQLAGRFSFHCSQMKPSLIHHHQVPTPSQISNSISTHSRKMTWTHYFGWIPDFI